MPRFTPEKKLLGEVANLDMLKTRISRMSTFQEGLAERRALTQEISTLGKFVSSNGFTPGRDFMRVASIPSSVWSAVMEIFGDEWAIMDAKQRQNLFYDLLAGPLQDYDLRKKPTVR